MIVYTASGRRLELTEPPLGQGGEGAVYRLTAYPERVAKIYRQDAESHRQKIEAMVSLSDAVEARPTLRNVAWPLAALYADPQATAFVGFGMRAVDRAFGMDELYEYPAPAGMSVSMAEKVDYLIGLAGVVDELHSLGQVVGDFNDNNLAMTRVGGQVALVDVDSFHATIGGRTYRCEVCMSGYMAPELIRAVRGTTFRDCPGPTFTKQTDRFSLAVHVFRMLFNGVHPYHCVGAVGPRGSVRAPLPLEKRVEQGSSPFFKKAVGVAAPAFAPRLEDFPDYLQELFRQAFVDGRADPDCRPTAAQWKKALTRYRGELSPCRADAAHGYARGAPSCPYCAADRRAALGAAGGVPAAPASAAAALVPALAPASTSARPARASSRRRGAAPAKVNGRFWLLTLVLAVVMFDLFGSELPVCQALSELIVGFYGEDEAMLYLLGACAGTLGYNVRHPFAHTGGEVLRSALSAIPGMLAAAAVQLAVTLLSSNVPGLIAVGAAAAIGGPLGLLLRKALTR